MLGLVNGEYKDVEIISKSRIKTPQEKINDLIEQLRTEDYKIIKCQEAYLTNRPLPYDINALVEKRDKIRDEINRLEKEIDEHSGGEIK